MAVIRAFNPASPGIGRRLAALPRMIKESVRGRYDGGKRLLLMAAASLYIISPLDAVPDFLLPFGIVDDAFVITWLFGTLLSETERFLDWEKSRGQGPSVVEAEVIRP